MKKILISLILVCVTINAAGQNSSIAKNDSIAYERYLSKTFAQYYPFPLLQKIYKYMDEYSKNNAEDRFVLKESHDNPGWALANTAPIGASSGSSSTVMVGTDGGGGSFRSYRFYDDRAFPDSLRTAFKLVYSDFRSKYPQKSVAQKELVEALKAFDKTAHNKPLFFADIHKSYNDDIEAYVKDMFKTSILIDNKQNQRFLRKPSAEKLQNDTGVKFVIGIALYKLWLTQQGKDNEPHK